MARAPGVVLGALIVALGAGTPPVAAAAASALDTLVAAERAFAALSVERGMKEAFLSNLADDAILFRPGPTNGKQIWRARGPSAAVLAWAPDYAEISGDGDLGVTSGPWKFHPARDKPPAGHGHFISVWRRMKDGAWRVVADIGIEHDAPAAGLDAVELVAGPAHAKPAPLPREFGGPVFGPNLLQGVGFASGPGYVPLADRLMASAINDMMNAERSRVRITRNHGIERAYVAHAADDVRVYRSGSPPIVGAGDAVRAVNGRGRRVELLPSGHGMSSSRDLGYGYGLQITSESAGAKPDTVSYLHVWRRDDSGHWKLALDVENEFGGK